MRQLLISLVLVVLSVNSYAMSFSQVSAIYAQVAKANGLIVAPHLVLSPDQSINANAAGFRITVNQGLLNAVRDKDEMAMVLGHELAHYELGHKQSTIPNEYAADHQGAIYMHKAGYSICIGAQLLRRFGSKDSVTHPAGTKRFHRLGC